MASTNTDTMLRELRREADKYYAGNGAASFVAKFEALDQALTRGAELPKDWSREKENG